MTIQLLYKYLRYDAEQLIDKYVKARLDDPEKRYAANLRSEDTNDDDLLRRLAMTGCSKVRSLLSKYLERNVVDATDALGEDGVWSYTFKPTVSADGQMLADLMHWAVVRFSMSAWCKMQGYTREADAEMAEADAQIVALLDAVKRQAMPMKQGKASPLPKDEIYIYYGEEN